MELRYVVIVFGILTSVLLGIYSSLIGIRNNLQRLNDIKYQILYGNASMNIQDRVDRKLRGYCRAHNYAKEEYQAIRTCIFDMAYLYEALNNENESTFYADDQEVKTNDLSV